MLWVSLAAPPGESLVTQRHLFCSRRSSFSARCSSSTLTRSLRQHLLLWSARAHLAAAASAAQRAACRAAGRAFPHSCRTAARRAGCCRRCASQVAVAHRQAHSGPGGASRCEGMCTCFVFSKPTDPPPPFAFRRSPTFFSCIWGLRVPRRSRWAAPVVYLCTWSTWSAVINRTSRAGELRSAPSGPDDWHRVAGKRALAPGVRVRRERAVK